MASRMTWDEFETVVARLQTTFNKSGVVTQNEKLLGKLSDRKRQIDICIRTTVGTESVLIIVECKKLNRKVEVKDIEAFIGVKADVGAQMGIMVSTEGFSKSAYKRAKDENISLYKYQDTQKENWPNGLETSALLEIWELTPIVACFILADGTEEAITTDVGLDFMDVNEGSKSVLATVLRKIWNTFEPGDKVERDWVVENPCTCPERPEISKLRLGARSKFVRGIKKGRLHFEGLVSEPTGQAKVASWRMIFDGPLTPWPVDKPLLPSKCLSLLIKSDFVQTQNVKAQAFHELIYNGALEVGVRGSEVMQLPVSVSIPKSQTGSRDGTRTR
jgi:hypothetical protein